MGDETLNFAPLKDEDSGLDETDLLILSKFETAISSSSQPNIEEKAIRIVAGLIAFTPEEPAALASRTWQVLMRVASRIPTEHHGQDVLIRVVSMLDHCRPWADLPGFNMSIRDSWNHSTSPERQIDSPIVVTDQTRAGPTFEVDAEDDLEFSREEWLNLNSFIARLFNIKGQRFANFALWEMRNGLEEDADDGGTSDVANARVLVASEWIRRSGPRIWNECVMSTFSDEPEDATHGSPYRGGALFTGSGGFNLERWGFWKRRLTELHKGIDASARPMIEEALEIICAVERRHGLQA